MTKKKAVPIRKKTSRGKSASSAATASEAPESAVPENKTNAAAGKAGAEDAARPATSRRAHRPRRTPRAAPAAPGVAPESAAEQSIPVEATLAPVEMPSATTETPAVPEASAAERPVGSASKRRRRRKKATRTKPPLPDTELPESARRPGPVAPAIYKPVPPRSPAARIEQRPDAIVIRFPEPGEILGSGRKSAFEPASTTAAAGTSAVEEDAHRHSEESEMPMPLGTRFEEPSFLQESADIEAIEPATADPLESLASPEADSAATATLEQIADETSESRHEGAIWNSHDESPAIDDSEEIEVIDVAEMDDRRVQRVELEEDKEPAREEGPSRRRRKRGRRDRRREEEPQEAGEVESKAEAEFGAEPTGKQEMIINVVPREECRIAIMEEGKLQEIYLERASSENYVGNIYKGIVTNVEPSIQAAFIDFGQGKNGFLHISDLHPQYFPNGEGNTENVGRKMPRRNRPPIQRCLRRGQQVLVQITKEGIGTKGPTLTTYLSIPGRFLVMMPGMRQLGVSRKIEDDNARRVLRTLLLDLELPSDAGFIARTAAMERSKQELQNDLNYLARLWKTVEKRIKSLKAPAELYTESDLVIRTIRDVYSPEIARIVIDDTDVSKRAREFLAIVSPRSRDIVIQYDEPEPIFHRYGIEEELERLHSRHVPLKSGGSLVIDQTEALVAIDVNSGRFRTEDDAETTAYKMDLEAADEIPRQLRLRDLGGVIICDFIDVRQEKHKREIERRLINNLKRHKERAKVLRMSEFGIIELTRQRQRASLTRNVYRDCGQCHGTGLVKTPESVALDAMRTIQYAATKDNIRTIEVFVSAEVADLLLNRKRGTLHDLEMKNHRKISIRTNSAFTPDEILVKCYDQRGRQIPAL